MIKVIVVDDHPVVRQGITRILTGSKKMEIAGEASTITGLYEVLAKVPEAQAIVLDLSLPGKSGFEALAHIKHDYPKIPILILSVQPEEQYALRALKAGAAGYLSKECAPEQLVQAVSTIVRSERYLTPVVANLLAEYLNASPGDLPVHTHLSNREFQVMQLIGKGRSLTDIARDFNLSVKSVSTYRVRILEKMKMKNNAEMIKYMIEHEL